MGSLFRRSRLLVAASAVVLTLTALAGPVWAAPSPTPNGFCGARNMVQAWGVGARGGMENAMSVDNPNGNAGMSRAVDASGCR